MSKQHDTPATDPRSTSAYSTDAYSVGSYNNGTSPEKKKPGRFAALKTRLANTALVGVGLAVAGAVSLSIDKVSTALSSVGPEPWQQFVQNAHNVTQVMQDNNAMEWGLVGGAVIVGGYAVKKGIIDPIVDKHGAPKAENLHKHPVWRKRSGESKKDYDQRVKILEDMAGMRLASRLPSAKEKKPELVDRVAKMVDEDGNINERLKKLGADSRFFDLIDAFDVENFKDDEGEYDEDKAAKAIYSVLGSIESKTGHESKRRPLIERTGKILAVGLAAIILLTPAIQTVSNSLSDHTPITPAPISQQYEAPAPGNPERPAVGDNEEDLSPDITEHAMNNADYEQDEELGYLTLPMLGNRIIHIMQGYAWDGDLSDPEIDPDSGYDYRLMKDKTGGVSNGTHYNFAATDKDGNPLLDPVLPGNKGRTTFAAHNGSLLGGSVGGFDDLDDHWQDGDKRFTFTASDGTVFVYEFTGENAVPRSGAVFNERDPQTNVNELDLQVCYDRGDDEYNGNVHFFHSILVEVHPTDGPVEYINH